jgi:hypothetical protein
MKSTRVGWAGHMARTRAVYGVVGKPESKRPYEKNTGINARIILKWI